MPVGRPNLTHERALPGPHRPWPSDLPASCCPGTPGSAVSGASVQPVATEAPCIWLIRLLGRWPQTQALPPGHAGRGHGPAAHTPAAPRHTERVLRPHCSPKPVCPECPRACWAAGAAALAGWGRASRRGHVGEDRPCGVVDAALPSADPDPRGGAGPTPHCPDTPPCPRQWLPACLELPVSCLHSWLPRPRARSPTAASVARRAPSVSPPPHRPLQRHCTYHGGPPL